MTAIDCTHEAEEYAKESYRMATVFLHLLRPGTKTSAEMACAALKMVNLSSLYSESSRKAAAAFLEAARQTLTE